MFCCATVKVLPAMSCVTFIVVAMAAPVIASVPVPPAMFTPLKDALLAIESMFDRIDVI